MAVADLIKQEVNVKELQLINADEAAHLIVKQIKPNFKALGARLGKDMKAVAGEIQGFSNEQIAQLESSGKAVVQGYEITLEDVEISAKDIPGWTVASEGKTTIALDITITDELKGEGIAREFVNRVQNLRKDKGFELTDRISISLEMKNPFIKEILNNQAYISAEVLADEINAIEYVTNADEIEIDDVRFLVEIEKR